MWRSSAIIIFLSILLGIQIDSNAQGGANSIFSRYGIGDLSGNNFMYARQMGGLGASLANPYHMNIENPASYAFLRSTSFDIGLSVNNTRISDSEFSSNIWSGNLEYLSLGFPLRNPLNEIFDREKKDWWLGMNISLLPFSSVNYNVISSNIDENIGATETRFRGDGGTYKVQWGNSLKYKNFSFGVNLGYLFGKIEYSTNVQFLDLANSYADNFTNDYSVNGFLWNVGAIYQYQLNKEAFNSKKENNRRFLNVGLYGNSKTSFSTEATQLQESVFSTIRDTFQFSENLDGKGKLPAVIGAGVSYSIENKSMIGIDYTFTNWGGYSNDANPEVLTNTYEVNIGGYFRPDYKSFKYKNRIYYRYGAFLRKDARSIEQNSISNYGLTVGLGLPFFYQRKISHINLGLTVGRRGQSDFLSETFVKLGLGLNFNDDEWFIQRKYN